MKETIRKPQDDVIIALHELPERLETMIRKLLLHKEEICSYNNGTLEFNFSDQSIKAKLTRFL